MTDPRWARRPLLPLLCALPPVLILAPVLRPGFVLGYDMVFTPRQPLLAESVGLGAALPRAVPADAVVALVSTVLPGELVQKLTLLLLVWAAVLGAARLVPTTSVGVRLTAGLAYGWNAYLAERLFIGHWSLLVAYALLPWIAAAALRLRRDRPPGQPGRHRLADWAALTVAMAPAVLVPTGGVLAAGVAVVLAGRRHAAGVIGAALVLNAPWWVPGVWHAGGAVSDPAAVAAFAARAEGPGGVLASVLGLGGIWNAQVVPASREGLLVPLTALLVLAGTAYGLRPLAAAWGRSAVTALGVLSVAGLLLATAAALPGLDAVLRWLVGSVPGAGLLRDAQKWAAWWALLAAPACALGVQRLATRAAAGGRSAVRAPLVSRAILLGSLLLPVALLPDLAWGGAGRLTAVSYPADWYVVRDLLADDDRAGDVLALPLQPFRRFGWNGDRTQLDPAPRFLPRGALVDDALTVGGVRLRGEDPRAVRARTAVDRAAAGDGPQAYRRAGIGWLLLAHGTPGQVEPAALRGLTVVHSGRWLTLYRVPGAVARPPSEGPPAAFVLVADGVAVLLFLTAAGIQIIRLLRRGLPIGRLALINWRSEGHI